MCSEDTSWISVAIHLQVSLSKTCTEDKRYMISFHHKMGGGNLMYEELAKCVVIF